MSNPKEYHLSWEIELYAESPREAAERALAIQRNPDSMATVFVVADEEGNIEHIDLEDGTDDQVEPVRQTPTGQKLLSGKRVVTRRRRKHNVIAVSKSDWAEIYYAVELKRLCVAEDNRKNGRYADGVDLAVWRRKMEHIADALGPDGERMHKALTALIESADLVTLRWAEADLQFAVQELDAALAPFGFGTRPGVPKMNPT